VVTGQVVPYQVALACATVGRSLDALPFESIRLDFSDSTPSLTITHDDSAAEASKTQLVLLKDENSKASLRWREGTMVFLSGVLASDSARELKVRPPDRQHETNG
jgi:hypothetical protein